jgi:hypothetical protein
VNALLPHVLAGFRKDGRHCQPMPVEQAAQMEWGILGTYHVER